MNALCGLLWLSLACKSNILHIEGAKYTQLTIQGIPACRCQCKQLYILRDNNHLAPLADSTVILFLILLGNSLIDSTHFNPRYWTSPWHTWVHWVATYTRRRQSRPALLGA
ncbi:hypothetical protein F5B20DRAFT_116918 [Whalleya microplaca]|nr:hypothetical protein F5B20DRAFT_116918 [Whalleya microplaca]